MPTIYHFGLDGNHFGVWSPSTNTSKHTYKYQDPPSIFLPNTKLLSPLDIKGKGLTDVE